MAARSYTFPNHIPPRYPPQGGFLLVPDLPPAPGGLAGFPVAPAIPPHVATGDVIAASHENQLLDAVGAIWGNVEWLQTQIVSQTPWASDIDAAGHKLNNAGLVSVANAGVSAVVLDPTAAVVAGQAPAPGQLIFPQFKIASLNSGGAPMIQGSSSTTLHIMPGGTATGAGIYIHNSPDAVNTYRLLLQLFNSQATMTTARAGTPATPITSFTIGENASPVPTLTNINFEFNGIMTHTFTPTSLGVGNIAPAYPLDVTGSINASATIGLTGAGKQTVIVSTDANGYGLIDLPGNVKIGRLDVNTNQGKLLIQPSSGLSIGNIQVYLRPQAVTGYGAALYLMNAADQANYAGLVVQVIQNTASVVTNFVGAPTYPVTSLIIGDANSGATARLTTIGFMFNTVQQFVFNSDGSLAMPALPAADPGAGSKKLWYDPADGNRVKFSN